MIDYEKVIIQWREFEVPESFDRAVNVPLNTGFIVSIIGPRRAGKTFVCFNVINKLLKSNVSKEQILYINFEDEKLLGANAQDLDKLLDTFYELYTFDTKNDLYLFFDEIQNVLHWDVWVRRIHDMHKNIHFILTGSSSKLLSREISTVLRGRVFSVEVFPLSLKELLFWKDVQYDVKTVSKSNKRFAVKKLFNEYLHEGGYPVIYTNSQMKQQILQNYFESIILKDIVERHNIRDFKKLKLLASLLFDNIAKEASYTKMANTLASSGYALSKKTVIDYISYFEDVYLFFQNVKYEYSLRKQLGSIKKVYCIDNGLLNAVSFKFSSDRGRLLENLVFVELKRRNKKVFYNKGICECDFVIQDKDRIVEAIQVTEKISSGNEEREVQGLLEAVKKFKLKQGVLLTHDEERTVTENGVTIRIIPVWKWLIE